MIIYEDEVIDRVRDYLTARGWEVVSRATVDERGEDLVMRSAELEVSIEAKGAGSSKPTSRRYGQPFTGSQVVAHVAKAVLKALGVASVGGRIAAIALPDTPKHRSEIDKIIQALTLTGITVFWVTADAKVTTEGADSWLG